MSHFLPVDGRPGFVHATVAVGRSVQMPMQTAPQVIELVTVSGGSPIEVSADDARDLLAGGFLDDPANPAAASRPRTNGQPTVNGQVGTAEHHPG